MIESALALLTSRDVVIGLFGLGVLLVFPRWWLLTLLVVCYACLLFLLAITTRDNVVAYVSWLIAQTLVPSFIVLGILIVMLRKWLRKRRPVASSNA